MQSPGTFQGEMFLLWQSWVEQAFLDVLNDMKKSCDVATGSYEDAQLFDQKSLRDLQNINDPQAAYCLRIVISDERNRSIEPRKSEQTPPLR